MKLEWLGGAAAVTFLATMGSASAVPVITPNTTSPLLNLGVGTAPNHQQGAPFNTGAVPAGLLAGTGIMSITYAGGNATGDPTQTSGVYAGSQGNIATTPFPPFNGLTPNPQQNYLAAQPGGTGVTVTYTTAQSSISILWGTIDPQDSRNLLVATTSGDMINGAAILAACGGVSGMTNCEVTISNLTGGTAMGFTATDVGGPSAFEFDPAVAAVPEPTSMAILGAALTGFGLLRRRKTPA